MLIHELAHAFIGGRYPVWFTEGVAEVVSYHLTGERSGYLGGSGRIDMDGSYAVFTPEYYNQGALGADFLEKLYDLAGAEEMASFLRGVAARSLSGEELVARIREMDVVDGDALEALIRDFFGAAAAR